MENTRNVVWTHGLHQFSFSKGEMNITLLSIFSVKLSKQAEFARACVLFTYQALWKQAALWRCRPEPWGQSCGGAPGPAEWLQSSLHCWPSECGVPQEQSASVVLEEKNRGQWKETTTTTAEMLMETRC